ESVRVAGVSGGGLDADAPLPKLASEVDEPLFAAGEQRDREAFPAETTGDGRTEPVPGTQDEQALGVRRCRATHGRGSSSPIGIAAEGHRWEVAGAAGVS